VSDIVVAKVIEPDQMVAVLAGDDYVALEVEYLGQDTEKCGQPDAVVLLGPSGAERLAYALRSAALKARELAAFIAAATTGANS
jgi:hypothetical protein